MKLRHKTYIYILIALTVTGSTIFAQDLPVQGLSDNKEYAGLIGRTNVLRKSEDSVQNLITRNRSLFDNRPDNSESYANEIVRLEGELYNIRSEAAKLGTRVAQIEQDFISRGMDVVVKADTSAEVAAPARATESRTLVLNDFFKANMSQKDINTFLLKPASAEARAMAVKSDVDKLYSDLGSLKQAYQATDRQQDVDRMLLEANGIIGRIRTIDSEIAKEWIPLYNQKIDTYMVLLDKINSIDRLSLEQLDQQSRTVRRAESLSSQQVAPNTAVFPVQKELVLQYEIALAYNLDLKPALDSLKKELAKIPRDKPEYPAIEFKPRNLIVYSAINLDGNYSYTSLDSIPDIKIPAGGLYYVISVAVMAKPPTALSFFKGGQPLQKEVLTDGRLRYTLGGFKNYAEAQKAVNQLLKAGFKAPNIVAWQDGKITTALKAKAAEGEQPKVTSGKFKIEVTASGVNVSQLLREIVDQNSSGKQIARVSEGDRFIFTITQFPTLEEAEKLAKIIESRENVEAKVLEVE